MIAVTEPATTLLRRSRPELQMINSNHCDIIRTVTFLTKKKK